MPCALCHLYSYRYRWRAVDREDADPAWGRHYLEDQTESGRYWIRECAPTCETNAQRAKLREARVEIDESLWKLYRVRRLLGVRYAASNLALCRLDGAEASVTCAWEWDVPELE